MTRTPRTTALRRVGVATALTVRTPAGAGDIAGASSTGTPASHRSPRSRGGARDPRDALAGEGVVTDLTDTSITVRDPRGASRTYALDASTMVRRDGTVVDTAQLRPGQRVAIVATRRRAATLVILPSDVGPDTAEGVVTDLTDTSITVRDPRGASRTYALDASTALRAGADHRATTLTSAGLAIGEHVTVEPASEEPDAAGAITVEPALVTGTIVAVAGDTLTVADHQGFYRPVRISPASRLTSAGACAALADVSVGASVVASGFVDATHTALNAATLDVDPSPDDPPLPDDAG